MSKGSLFTGVWARCQKHGKLLKPGEDECQECKILQRNLALVPPFDVLCVDSTYDFKKGQIYEVVWVVRQASTKWNHNTSGYCFEHTDNSIVENMADPLKFIPVQYLTEDKKDSWLVDQS